jgi:D-alanyl-D-alanine carboxypeptidase
MHALSRTPSAWTGRLARVLPAIALLVALVGPAAANPKYAGIVYDIVGDKTLYADDADEKRYPASLTKIMTLYIVFEELAAGRLALDSKLTVSKYASRRPPSKLGFKPGAKIAVRDAIMALVTKSANDVATAVGENISGSEAAFAKRMTKTARRLGMASTTFRNASGLPNAKQVTTARDMVKLGIAIQRDFPQYYGVFETRVFEFRSRSYRNHNRLLGRVAGVDGIKTGYIRASGFNLVTSVRRGGRHIVAVVMGGRTGASRNRHMRDLVGRYLPKAERGEPMVFAAWRGDGPPPVPRSKPLGTLFASRLAESGDESDPIGEKVLAFAAATRSSVGPAGEEGEGTAAGALRAVIAQGEGAARASGTRKEAPAIEAVSAPATSGLPEAANAALAAAGSRATGRGDPRLDDAFRLVAAQPGALDAAALVAAIERARNGAGPGRATGAVGATGAAGAGAYGWQIQLGAVPSKDEARRLLDEALGEVPALDKHHRVTLPVTTERGTLYRARLSGFRSREAARAACKRFANHDRPCWAVSM